MGSQPDHSVRSFQFERDTFAFPHELVWRYRFDPVTGAMTVFKADPPPTYYHRCFVLVRSVRQFFQPVSYTHLLLSAMETNSILQMTLQPRSASARKFIGEIVIGFRTNDFSIAVTEMRFADGSSMRNDFTNVVLNQSIPLEVFEEKLPADMSIVEPLRK